jgi:hypothetical protein
MQKIGAAITYARRFGLVSLLALESEDDDGETAVGRPEKSADFGQTKSRNPVVASSGNQKSAGIGDGLSVQNAPVQAKVPPGVNRKTINEKISLTSKVLVDSKRATQEEVLIMLKAYGVESKEALNDDQAVKLLNQLETKLNG